MSPIYGGPAERIELLTYTPGLQGGADLEAATKTISNTVENAVADYTSIHTIAAPTDARIAVLRGCMRLTVTIDSWGGGGVQLNYRVKRGGVSVSTGVLAVAAATGQKIISWDITTLITGAQTNTLFLWVDVGTCVISEATMWTGVGSMQSSIVNPCWSITHKGQAQFRFVVAFVGTGTHRLAIASAASNPVSTLDLFCYYTAAANFTHYQNTTLSQIFLLPDVAYFYLFTPTVVTDLPYFTNMGCVLRSQQ